MKRFILPLLAVLLLCGCNADNGQTTAANTAATQPTVVEYLYDPNSTIEELTQGAIQACSLEGRSVTGMRFFADRLLLLTTDDHVELTTVLVLDGTELGIVRSVTLDCALAADELTVSADGKTIAYYYPQENSLVLLDSSLTETRRIHLPDQVTDRPVLSSDLTTAYYCVDNSIYALDLESGLPRLLKQHSCIGQSLRALHFDDTVLEVFLTLESGDTQVAFISPENGETTGTDRGLLTLSSQGSRYLLQRLDGTVTETLTGQVGGQPQTLEKTVSQTVWPAFSLNGLVGVNGGTLQLYDLDSGRVASYVDLGEDVQVLEVDADPTENRVWLRVLDRQTDKPLLLCWNVAQTKTESTTVYLHKRYTADEPDEAGIARCQQQADTLCSSLGLTLQVSGSFPAPEGYEYVYEHQVTALEDTLAQLESALAALPPEFLQGLATVNQSGTVRIGLVRQILDLSGQPVSDMGGLHFVTAGDHYIVLTVDGSPKTALLHQLCHVLDSFIYAHSDAYDSWNELNPEDFTYSGSYTVDTTLDDPRLQGEGQCFVSSYGMTYAKEDRAILFTAAMEPNGEVLLAIPGLQSKLRYLCDAIREAYGWEETDLTLPWEQHLTSE